METPQGIPDDELSWARTTDRYLGSLNHDFQPIRSFQGKDLDQIDALNERVDNPVRFVPMRKWDMEERKMEVVLTPLWLN